MAYEDNTSNKSLDLTDNYWDYSHEEEQEEQEEQSLAEEKSNYLIEINRKWNEQMDEGDSETDDSVSKLRKSVQFAPESELASICPILSWGYSYQNAGIGLWQRVSQSFRCRINNFFAAILNPILSKEHRYLIFERRFQSDTHADHVQCVRFDTLSESDSET